SSAPGSGLIAHLGHEPFEPRLGRGVDAPPPRRGPPADPRDRLPHLQRDGAVRRIALAARAQLDQVERLAGVELEDVADAIGEAPRVPRLLDKPLAAQPLVLRPRRLKRLSVLRAEAGLLDLVRDVGAEVGREPLPLAREQTVPLKIPERAVVGHDLEAVRERLEAAPRPVAP